MTPNMTNMQSGLNLVMQLFWTLVWFSFVWFRFANYSKPSRGKTKGSTRLIKPIFPQVNK